MEGGCIFLASCILVHVHSILPLIHSQSNLYLEMNRNRLIYERRMAGATYRQLGLEEGISATRVGQIIAREQRRINIQERARLYVTGGFRPIDMGGPRDVWIEEDLC